MTSTIEQNQNTNKKRLKNIRADSKIFIG